MDQVPASSRTFAAPCDAARILRAGAVALLLTTMALWVAGCGGDSTVANPVTATKDTKVDPTDLGADDADGGSDDAQPSDVGSDNEADVGSDTQPDVTTDTGPVCPGGPGCTCAKSTDCDSGQCIQVPEGYRCAQPCVTGCDPGYSCKLIGGADAQAYCLPNFLSLCAPCQTNTDCATVGIDALCLDYGALGSYCGSPCTADSDCPTTYECVTVAAGGSSAKQCKLKPKVSPGSGASCPATPCAKGETCLDGTCQSVAPSQCGCSQWAVQYGKSTQCSVTNSFGSCKAERTCTATGLSDCGAKTPAAEQCNLKDDDCNGITDDLATDFVCYKTAFAGGGSGSNCKGDADCTTPGEACDTNGLCHPLIGKCPGKPTCAANGALICNDTKTPKLEQCNGEDDDCDGLIDEDFTWSAPGGGSLDIGKTCGFGPCGGGKVVCISLNEAACTTDSKATKEVCDGIDNDCDGQTDDLACDDNNKCTTDSCDPNSGKCSTAPAVNCDDGNQCTMDSCNPKDAQCGHEASTGSCDDGDKCTVGDTCKLGATGLPQCTTGTAAANCDDANPCTDDSCAPEQGCVHLANAATQTCYTGAAGTVGVGTCVGGLRFCKDGVLGSDCLGEVLPNKNESCDGLDDTCNGKTDENCSATTLLLSYAPASQDVLGSGGARTTLQFGGSMVGGVAAGTDTSNSVWLGFIAWVGNLIK